MDCPKCGSGMKRDLANEIDVVICEGCGILMADAKTEDDVKRVQDWVQRECAAPHSYLAIVA